MKPFWDWIAFELELELPTVSAGLEDKDELGLPRLLEQIVWRSAAYSQALTDWLTGDIDFEWSRDRKRVTLAETANLVTTH